MRGEMTTGTKEEPVGGGSKRAESARMQRKNAEVSKRESERALRKGKGELVKRAKEGNGKAHLIQGLCFARELHSD